MEKQIIKNASLIQNKLENHANYLWENAEYGFELYKTVAYVKKQLSQLDIEAIPCGKSGMVATITGNKKGRSPKTFLLRADMDALRGVDSLKPQACMHACGHHFHTSMLIGAAEILMGMRDSFCGNVKLMFQPAEEILSGARDMINDHLLKAPTPDGAMMLHVMSAVDLPMGSIIVSSAGVGAPAAHFFEIEVEGKGTHGAMPHKGVDAITVSAYILTALNEINARELPIGEPAAITIGRISGGKSANVLPDKVKLWGSLRAFDTMMVENIKERIADIAKYTAKAMRAEANVKFTHGCPPLLNDEALSKCTYNALSQMLGDNRVIYSQASQGLKLSGASDDFSYVTQKIPSITASICAGSTRDGYKYPLHNPKVAFDKQALSIGAAVYACVATAYLENSNEGESAKTKWAFKYL